MMHRDQLRRIAQNVADHVAQLVAVLEAHGITCSMSRRGDCYDNAVMESVFSTVKTELGEHFESTGDAKMELFDYIELFYNPHRRHSTLDYVSPACILRSSLIRGWPTRCRRHSR